jgi:hypothetical protein
MAVVRLRDEGKIPRKSADLTLRKLSRLEKRMAAEEMHNARRESRDARICADIAQLIREKSGQKEWPPVDVNFLER